VVAGTGYFSLINFVKRISEFQKGVGFSVIALAKRDFSGGVFRSQGERFKIQDCNVAD